MSTHAQKMVARDIARRDIDPSFQPSDTEIVKNRYGYTQDNAESAAFRTLNSVGVLEELESLREDFESKVPNSFLVKRYIKLLNARDPIVYKGEPTGKSVPNYATQSEMLKIGFKMKGALADNISIDIDARSVQLAPESISTLSSIISGMSALSAKLGLVQSSSAQVQTSSPSPVDIRPVDTSGSVQSS